MFDNLSFPHRGTQRLDMLSVLFQDSIFGHADTVFTTNTRIGT